ncbi:hypothetical protein D9M71_305460 [compost metagenome]
MIALATQALDDTAQALAQALGIEREALFAAMYFDELGAQVDYIILENALDTAGEAVFQPYHGEGLHALVQGQWRGAAANHAPFIFEHELFDALGTLLQQVDRQQVFEVDLRRLRRCMLAEAGATVVGMFFQVQRVVQGRQYFGLAGAGQTADQDEVALCQGVFGSVDQEVTQRLVATDYPWVFNASFAIEPLLCDLRAQAAAKTVQKAFRVRTGKPRPAFDTLLLDRAGHQRMAQFDGSLLTLLLVAGADLLPFDIVHQWLVDGVGEGTLVEFHRGAYIHQRDIVEKDFAVVGTVVAHQITSTAWLCRTTNSPMGARTRPSSLATARNSASPLGATATSSPPLVCGSHSKSFCISGNRAMRSP